MKCTCYLIFLSKEVLPVSQHIMSSFHFSAINGPVKQLQNYRYTLILPILSLRSFCHLYNSILLKIMKIGLTLCLCLAFSLAWSSNSYKQAQGESDDDKRETVKKFLQHLAARNGNLVHIIFALLIFFNLFLLCCYYRCSRGQWHSWPLL